MILSTWRVFDYRRHTWCELVPHALILHCRMPGPVRGLLPQKRPHTGVAHLDGDFILAQALRIESGLA